MDDSERLVAIAREAFQDDHLSLGSRLEDARGYDSLTHIKLVIAIAESFGVSLDEDKIPSSTTIGEVFKLIVAMRR